MTRTKTLPVVVVVLGLLAIAAILALARSADQSRHAQLDLANVKVELNKLQTAPFRASRRRAARPPGIIAVCDAFDAMVSERPYRKARTVEDALDELRQCAGTQFDPQVVEVFCGLALAVRSNSLQPA